MTELMTNFRLGMKYKEFTIEFWSFLLNSRERQIWVWGWGTVFAEVHLGQDRQLFWCLKAGSMDRSDWWEAKGEQGVSSILLKLSPVWSIHSITLKASKQSPILPQVDLCKSCASSPHPKLPFPWFQQSHKKSILNSFYLIPSLKSVINSVISSLFDYLRRVWPRESPLLSS